MNAEGGPESAREPGTTTAKAWREQRSTPLVLRSVRAAMGRTTLVARTPRMNECQEIIIRTLLLLLLLLLLGYL